MPMRLINRRIDHNPVYLSLLVALLIIAIMLPLKLRGVGTAHAALNSVVADSMAAAMGLGCAFALFGAASGTRWLRQNADIRDCFDIQGWALLPTIIAACVFWVGLVLTHEDLQVAVLLVGIIVGLGWTSFDLHVQSRRLTADLKRRQQEAEAGHGQ